MTTTDNDYDLTEGLDPEGPSAEDLDRFGDELRTCPACNEAVYDQVEICPVCGHAFERPSKGPPIWVLVTAGIALLAFLLIVLL